MLWSATCFNMTEKTAALLASGRLVTTYGMPSLFVCLPFDSLLHQSALLIARCYKDLHGLLHVAGLWQGLVHVMHCIVFLLARLNHGSELVLLQNRVIG